MILIQEKREFFIQEILVWGDENRRQFPWRITKDPYHILVAELMLQRTKAKQVEKIYINFLKQYPSPAILAQSSVEEISNELYSIGLSYRAIRLKRIGEILNEKFNSKIPDDIVKLLSLPGVGKYIANAILCFAFDRDVALVDSNIIRIMRRVFSLPLERDSHKKDEIWEIMNNMIPQGKSRDFNLSILDFASLICSAKNPKHDKCPIKMICDDYKILIH